LLHIVIIIKNSGFLNTYVQILNTIVFHLISIFWHLLLYVVIYFRSGLKGIQSVIMCIMSSMVMSSSMSSYKYEHIAIISTRWRVQLRSVDSIFSLSFFSCTISLFLRCHVPQSEAILTFSMCNLIAVNRDFERVFILRMVISLSRRVAVFWGLFLQRRNIIFFPSTSSWRFFLISCSIYSIYYNY